jgi:hypothetical protein
MADQAPAARSAPEFPSSTFPNAFADTVTSLANSATTVKFFLARFEPDFHGGGTSKPQPFAQIVMPMEGFAAAFCFFENRIKTFVEQGFISQARLDEFRRLVESEA